MRTGSGLAFALRAGAFVALLAAPAVAEPPLPPPPSQAPAPGRRFHDWQITCAGGCQALTRIVSAAPGAPEVLRLSIRPVGEDVFALSLRTPAPLYLPEAAVLAPDRAEPVAMPWFTCDPRGCEARLTAGVDLVAALRAGQAAMAEITLVDGSRARLRVSLLGLTAALDAAGKLGPPKPRTARP